MMITCCEISLQPGEISLEELKLIYENKILYHLDSSVIKNILNSAKIVEDITKSNKFIYGINTGFGLLAHKTIPNEQIKNLQRKIILSHCAGVGDYLSPPIVRLILALKINALAQGYSGIQLKTVDYLLKFYNAQVYPCIPAKGSVGASGDLAPLAAMSAPLLGEGKAFIKGKVVSGIEALEYLELPPLELEAKEGLALINGTQVSTALALDGLFKGQNLLQSAVAIGALSIEASKASHAPFDERIQIIRRQRGQFIVANWFRSLLQESEIHQSHQKRCSKIQDPYSLRCQPQVLGACFDQIEHAQDILLKEANAVTDNPLVFSQNEIVSGGNFHAQPVAFAADNLALALAEIGSISERKTAYLIDSKMSGLPSFLVKNEGLNSGFMIPQYTAAALVSENKCLTHPSSVDSIPTSANQEDHVSMATYGAKRLGSMAENVAHILAIEALAAAQALDFHRPLKTSEKLENLHQIIRKIVNFYEEDRFFTEDIELAANFIKEGSFNII